MKNNQFNELLLSIIEDSAQTQYGKKYHFEYLRTVDGYRHVTPLTEIEHVQPFIELTTRIGEANIFTSDKIVSYALTSGTSEINHYVPCNEKHLKDYIDVFEKVMALKGHKAILFESIPANIVYFDGAKLDTISGCVLQSVRKKIDKYHLSSPEELLFRNDASDITYYRTLFAVADPKIKSIVAPFTWSVMSMVQCIINEKDRIINDIASGTISFEKRTSDELKSALQARFTANKKRANQLEKILSKPDYEGLLTKIWPKLKMITAAGTGRFEIYTDNLKKYLGKAVLNNGYFIASEAIVGEAVNNSDTYKLCTNNAYIEFKPLDSDKTVLYDEVEIGKEYSLYVTNKSGLFRYRLGDIVEVTDLKDGVPYFKYLRRTNEKVSESLIYEGIKKIAEEYCAQIDDFCFVVNEDDSLTVYLETAQSFLFKKQERKAAKLFDSSLKVKTIKFLAPGSQNKYKRLRALGGNMAADQLKPVRRLSGADAEAFFELLAIKE